MFPFPLKLNYLLPMHPQENGSREGIIGVFDPTAARPLICESIDISGPEWRAFEEIAHECLKHRNPPDDLLRELERRRAILRRLIMPIFGRMELEQMLGTNIETPDFLASGKRGMA